MPIDIATEELLPLRSVPGRFPGLGRNGRPIHHASIYRWAVNGCRGVRLETVQVGGMKVTSTEALERFVERLSNPSETDKADATGERARQRRSSRQRQKAAEKAGRELEAIGA